MDKKTRMDLFGDDVVTLDLNEPCWLYAGIATNLESGDSWRFVYRSTALKTIDPIHQRAVDYLGGALPAGDVRLVTDPGMMFGVGELTLWETPRP